MSVKVSRLATIAKRRSRTMNEFWWVPLYGVSAYVFGLFVGYVIAR